MAEIPPQDIGAAGKDVTYQAAAAADYIVWDPAGVLKVRNGGVGSVNLTATGQKVSNFGGSGDKVWAIPNGAAKEFEIADFDGGRFTDGNGRVQLAYSSVTTVTVAYVRRMGRG